MLQDTTLKSILELCGDLRTYPEEALSPYREFKVSGKTYYFTPGGFVYCKEPGIEEVGASTAAI